MTLRTFVVAALLVLFSTAPALAQLSPLRYGTWVLNVAKSKYDPGPPPMSQKRTEEFVNGAMRTSVEGVDARGNRIAYEFAVAADGKDHPVTGVGIPYGSDTIAMTVLDPFTLDATFKKGGTVMGTAHAVMSKDGRTLTVTSKSQTTNNVTIWEKSGGSEEVRK
jgi:hypothetical protein